jgi:hypothetical protein
MNETEASKDAFCARVHIVSTPKLFQILFMSTMYTFEILSYIAIFEKKSILHSTR